ncbi:MAG TPA: tetratricopeptide repeat protein [Fimbriimonadales bacterium]|nr:tetratricopeptide repeat protein [Fimbriimonadales bacterium]
MNIRLAIIYGLQENATKAEEHLTKALNAKYEGAEVAQVYNAIGDIYQNSDKYDKAIDYFRKAEKSAKDPWDRSYAKLSIVFCYLQKRDNDNAKKEAQELLKLPDLDADHKKMAEEILKYLSGG